MRPPTPSPGPLGDAQELASCRIALEANPADVRAILKMGDIFFRRGEHDRALSFYERGAELYVSSGLLVKAIAVFKQMHWLIDRHAPELRYRFGYTHARLAGIFETLGLTDDALALWQSVARRHLDQAEEAEARAVLEHVLSIAAHDVSARMMLATLRARAGDVDGAIVLLEQAVTITLSHGRLTEALAALRGLLALRENADHARLAADVLLDMGGSAPERRERALEALGKLSIAYRANPRSFPTLRLLVRAFDRIGEPDKGNEVLKETARIAYESGARDTFARILEALHTRAPGDNDVARLDLLR